MSALGNLDDLCPVCGVRAGSHTLDKHAECMSVATTDEEYRSAPEGLLESVPAGTVLADNVNVKALVVHAGGKMPELVYTPGVGQIRVDAPAVFCEFGTSESGVVRPVARVLYVAGDVEVARKFGRLMRDTANGAANAAEKARERSPGDMRGAQWRG